VSVPIVPATIPLYPLVAWDRVDDDVADACLEAWGHWLGPCNRPFGKQSWALWLDNQVVAVAVSASTVNAKCAGMDRKTVVELARLCAHPEHRDLTRVALRLWRVTAAGAWEAVYWPVQAYVSYANAIRHTGDIYRFDGWKKVADRPASRGWGGWQKDKTIEPMAVWVYRLKDEHAERRER
jgi:hypothetical protein